MLLLTQPQNPFPPIPLPPILTRRLEIPLNPPILRLPRQNTTKTHKNRIEKQEHCAHENLKSNPKHKTNHKTTSKPTRKNQNQHQKTQKMTFFNHKKPKNPTLSSAENKLFVTNKKQRALKNTVSSPCAFNLSAA